MATSRFATQPRVSRSPKSAQIPDNIDPNDPMLAKARAFAETIRQLESGRTLKNPVKLPVFNEEGTDFLPDAFPVRPERAKPPERRKSSHRRLSDAPAPPDLARHRRKCVICNHPDREEIEEQFTHWRRPGDIAYDFDIEETRYIHRHAHAVGLYARRRENYLFTLENLLERGDEIELTASAYIKAVRAYACMCDIVRWTEPAIRVAHEYHVHTNGSSQPEGPRPQPASKSPAPASSAPSAPLVGATLGSPAPATQAASEDSAPSALQGSSNKSPKPDNDPRATGRVPSPAPGFEPPASSPNRPSPRLEMGVSDRKQRKEVLSNRP